MFIYNCFKKSHITAQSDTQKQLDRRDLLERCFVQGAHNQHACLHCVLSPTLFIIHACYNYCVNFCLCLYSRIRIIVECVILYTVGSFAQPVSPVIQELMDKFQLTTTQVDRKIQQIDIPYLAIHFDNVELYVDVMELSSGEQIDVKHADTNQLAMIKCLKLWKGKKPAQATFKTLLVMLVKLRKEEIAGQVCQYLKVSLFVRTPCSSMILVSP